jgi:hypothetical protein
MTLGVKRIVEAEWADRKRCADPADLNRCIFRSRRRVGWCEFSDGVFGLRPAPAISP